MHRFKILFLQQAYLNNTDTSMEYVTSLKSSLETSINDAIGQNLTQYDKEKITNCLSGLASVNIRLKSVSEFGFSQLRSSAVKPRVKPWLDTFFHGVSIHFFLNVSYLTIT
jgi:hypothetical protein